jgi:hypothetical protein
VGVPPDATTDGGGDGDAATATLGDGGRGDARWSRDPDAHGAG